MFGNSGMGMEIHGYWNSQYESHGDRIGLIYLQAWGNFMDFNILNPAIALEREATNFVYSEATAAHEYDRYGRQAFSIMPMMAEMFENTDLGDLTLADLHMPFDCFYVSLEDSKVPFLDGFYVHRRRDVGGDVLAFVGFGFQCDADHINETWPDSYTPRSEQEGRDRDGYFRYHFEIQLNRTAGSVHDEKWSRTPLWGGVPLEQVIDRIHDHPDLTHGLDTVRGFAGLGMADGNREEYKTEIEHGEWPVDKMSRYMVRTAMSLLLYLNSDNRSVVVTSEREEIEKAEKEIAAGKKGRSWGRKGKKGRAATERRKHLSTARVTRVGGKETAAITGRPGFSFDQPRHWRRGHFHHYWTGPKKVSGVEIPFGEWKDKRTRRRPWVVPILINPDAELALVTTRTVIHHEDETKWMDDIIEQKTEGDRKETVQTNIERDPRNRRLCIEAHGEHCWVCGKDGGWMDDDMRLNKSGLPSAWLHCHHIEPLGESAPRKTDPVKDMVPLCAECHTMMHLRKPALTLDEGMMFHGKRTDYENRRKAKQGAK